MSTSLNTLIAKLNPTCRQAALLAANNCLARGHYEVDLEHLLLALLEEPASDVTLVLRASRVDAHALRADVERELQRLKTGNTRTPVFSKHLIDLLEQAWLIASLDSRRASAARLVDGAGSCPICRAYVAAAARRAGDGSEA
jgi:type VI secretion system protein VasG